MWNVCRCQFKISILIEMEMITSGFNVQIGRRSGKSVVLRCAVWCFLRKASSPALEKKKNTMLSFHLLPFGSFSFTISEFI